MPPTTYVKKGSRPSVAPQQFTSTFDGISKNPVSPLVSSFTPSVEPPKLNQNIISHDIVTHRPLNSGTTRYRIPSYPRKRATPKPAFGRFVPPTGGSKKFHNTTLMKISPQYYCYYHYHYCIYSIGLAVLILDDQSIWPVSSIVFGNIFQNDFLSNPSLGGIYVEHQGMNQMS